MRNLTEEELSKCPASCNYYNIINGDVYFTTVLGIGVYDINGTQVDDSLLDGIFVKSAPIEKPFNINEFESSMHQLDEPYIEASSEHLLIDGTINKEWAIAIAKHFKITKEDLK